jgi:hypothetical protein
MPDYAAWPGANVSTSAFIVILFGMIRAAGVNES